MPTTAGKEIMPEKIATQGRSTSVFESLQAQNSAPRRGSQLESASATKKSSKRYQVTMSSNIEQRTAAGGYPND